MRRGGGTLYEKTELDEVLEKIILRMEGAEEIFLAKNEDLKNANKERNYKTGESGNKNTKEISREDVAVDEEDASPCGPKKKRLSLANATMVCLRERQEEEMELKRMELDLKEREISLKEREQQQQYELKKRELQLKEKEQENRREIEQARQEKESKLVNVIQQQQLIFSQFYQQNQLLLKKLTEK